MLSDVVASQVTCIDRLGGFKVKQLADVKVTYGLNLAITSSLPCRSSGILNNRYLPKIHASFINGFEQDIT